MSRRACASDRVEARLFSKTDRPHPPPPPAPPAPGSPLHVRLRFACVHWPCYVSELCACVLSLVRWDVPAWMRAPEIVMRCQLDFSQLITGCTWGVSVSLTHSHMLFPVLIFQLGHVMLTSHSVHSLSRSLSLSPSVLFSCGSLLPL